MEGTVTLIIPCIGVDIDALNSALWDMQEKSHGVAWDVQRNPNRHDTEWYATWTEEGFSCVDKTAAKRARSAYNNVHRQLYGFVPA